jgi:Uma2 family endonuclease
MGAKTALTVEEYLHTSFPGLDKEYRDGELVERSLPTFPHGNTQLRLGAFFLAQPKHLKLFPTSETRMKVRDELYLIPDVSVFHPVKPDTPVPEMVPFVAIEILSPDDRQGEVREKLEQYRLLGVPFVWLVDPNSRRLYQCAPGLTEVSLLRIPELGIELTPNDVFGE